MHASNALLIFSRIYINQSGGAEALTANCIKKKKKTEKRINTSSMYSVQLSKTVAQNVSKYKKVAKVRLFVYNLAAWTSTLLRNNVFIATFLPQVYFPEFDTTLMFCNVALNTGVYIIPDCSWSRFD
jgi:hypothetical protein